MRVYLPARIELSCPKCKLAFSVQLRLLHDRAELLCPFCRRDFRVYDALPPQLRRKVYYTMRDEIEHQVYTEYKKKSADYFDEWGATADSDLPD